jgi:hypothetical protein
MNIKRPVIIRKILWRVMRWREAREKWIEHELSNNFYRNYERKPYDIQKTSSGPFLMSLKIKGT